MLISELPLWDYTENLLQLHDAEIVRLRNYYEVHKELFEGVQKWEESWRLFLEVCVCEEGIYKMVDKTKAWERKV